MAQEREEVLSEALSRVRQLEAERHTEAAALAKAEVRSREAERAAETTVRVLEQQVPILQPSISPNQAQRSVPFGTMLSVLHRSFSCCVQYGGSF